MANGQVLYEAPKSNLGGLAQLYMAGQAEVRKVRSEVQTQRAAEMESLGKTISDLQLTGLHSLDTMYNSSGNLLRNRISQAHADNQAGFITRADATRITNQAIAEANMIVNSAEIVGKNYETLKEDVKDGDVSGAALSQFESSYFGFYRAMDPKLKRITILTDGPQGLTFQHTYQYYDADGKVKDGVKNSPLQNSINPTQANIAGFNVIDWTKDIRSGIGDLASPVLGGTHNMSGKQINQWVRNHANDPRIKATIEKMINGYTDNDLIGVLYDGKGVRPRWDAAYTGDKTQAEINGMVEGNYVDKDGKIIKFADGQLFTLDSDIEGNYKITDDQRALARSYLRMSAYTALDIEWRNISNKPSSSKIGFNGGLSFQQFNFQRGKNHVSLLNMWNAMAQKENRFKKAVGEGTGFATMDVTKMGDLNYIIDNQVGKSNLLGKDTEGWKRAGKMWLGSDGWGTKGFDPQDPTSFNANMFQNSANNYNEIFIGGTSSKPSGFNLKSVEGQRFKHIDEIGYLHKNIDGEERVVIVIGGSVSNSTKTGKNTGPGGSTTYQTEQEEINQTIGFANSKQSQKIWNSLYENYEKFQDAAVFLKLDKDGKTPISTPVNDKFAYMIMLVMNKLKI